MPLTTVVAVTTTGGLVMTDLTAVVTVFTATESLVAVLAEESLGTVCVLAALVC